MRLTRLYTPGALSVGQKHELDGIASHHLCTVLRQSVGDELILFNGQEDAEYLARLTRAHKKQAEVEVYERQPCSSESGLRIHLYQGVSRGDRMDFAVQKATELGAHEITPVVCQRSQVRLSGEKGHKKRQHWQQIAVHAAQQSGRCRIPEIQPPASFDLALGARTTHSIGLFLHTRTSDSPTVDWSAAQDIDIWIGPEGGFNEEEVQHAKGSGLIPLQLGPRTLRTETATVAALAACQLLAGDFNVNG